MPEPPFPTSPSPSPTSLSPLSLIPLSIGPTSPLIKQRNPLAISSGFFRRLTFFRLDDIFAFVHSPRNFFPAFAHILLYLHHARLSFSSLHPSPSSLTTAISHFPLPLEKQYTVRRSPHSVLPPAMEIIKTPLIEMKIEI